MLWSALWDVKLHLRNLIMTQFGELLEMHKHWKKMVCFLLGHQPRGPVKEAPVLYRCDRCEELIEFDRDNGWSVYHE
jgi:hypothetical protein